MQLIKSFLKDKSANATLMFGLVAIPLIAAVGAAMDYSRAASMRTKLQSTIDSAAMTLARRSATLTPAQLQTEGDALVRAMLADTGGLSVNNVTVSVAGQHVTVNIAGSVPAYFGGLFGSSTMAIGTTSTARRGVAKIEVALVLDNTGSMASSGKIEALRTAVTNFINAMEAASTGPGSIKISMVPFNQRVKVNPSHNGASWLRSDLFGSGTWHGCIADRDQNYDTNDSPPLPGVTATLYPKMGCVGSNLIEIKGLTDNYNALRTHAALMSAGGTTNITIGIAWGLATLSPGEPFTGASAYGDPDVEKFMIVLTDGENTQNRWTSNPASIDSRTIMACNTVKAHNVKLYTIRVIEGNASLLQSCATNTTMYYDVNNAAQLNPVFQTIASAIKGIRLTN